MDSEKDVLDWEDLSPEDQAKVEELYQELNAVFNKYVRNEPCEDSTSTD